MVGQLVISTNIVVRCRPDRKACDVDNLHHHEHQGLCIRCHERKDTERCFPITQLGGTCHYHQGPLRQPSASSTASLRITKRRARLMTRMRQERERERVEATPVDVREKKLRPSQGVDQTNTDRDNEDKEKSQLVVEIVLRLLILPISTQLSCLLYPQTQTRKSSLPDCKCSLR